MKAVVSRRALADALKRTAPARAATGHPVTSCVRIEASHGQVEVTSTDLDLTVHQWSDDDGDPAARVDGVSVVPAAPLTRFLAAATGERVHLTHDDGAINVVCGDVALSLRTVPAEEWPESKPVDGETHKVTTETVAAILRSVHAASTDGTRPLICHVAINKGHVVATDSHRLIATPCDLPDILLPPTLLRVMPAGEAELTTDGDSIIWSSGSTTARCRPYDGDYPNWPGLFPEPTHAIEVNADELADVVKAVNVLEPSSPAGFEYHDGRLRIWRYVDEQRSEASIEARCDTEPPAFGLDPRYLLDGLSVHEDDTITLRTIDDKRPVLWDTTDGGRYLLMPCATGWRS